MTERLYKVSASYTNTVIGYVEAESLEEAEAMARSMDGSEFREDPDAGSDWSIDHVEEVTEKEKLRNLFTSTYR